MAHKNDCAPALKGSQETHALLRKNHVPDRQRLVNDEHVCINVSNDSERQPKSHSTGIGLYRLIDKVSDVCESRYVIKPGSDLIPGKTQNRAIKVDIFAPCELRIETASQLQEGGDAASDGYFADSWTERAGNYLQ
jgi:hypothetical protein